MSLTGLQWWGSGENLRTGVEKNHSEQVTLRAGYRSTAMDEWAQR